MVEHFIGDVKSKLKWADGSVVKREVDLCLMLLLGPKTIADLYPKKEKTWKNNSGTTHQEDTKFCLAEVNNIHEGKLLFLHFHFST